MLSLYKRLLQWSIINTRRLLILRPALTAQVTNTSFNGSCSNIQSSLVKDLLSKKRVYTSNTTDILKGKGIQRGAGRKSDLRGSTRRISNQLLMETISLNTLRQTLLWREEKIWINPDFDDSYSLHKV